MRFFDEASLRLKQMLGVTTDSDVAQMVGLTKAAWYDRKKRGRFPEVLLYAASAKHPEWKLDVPYVLTGRASNGAVLPRPNAAATNTRAEPTESISPTKGRPQGLKTLDEVNAAFTAAGISRADWARAHQFKLASVYQVLNGKKKGLRGEAHKVAVMLGLKRGHLDVQPIDFLFRVEK